MSFTPSNAPGGNERSVALLAQQMVNRGLKVKVASFPRKAVWLERNPSIDVLDCPGRFLRGQALTLLLHGYAAMKRLEKAGAELIHVYNVFPAAAAGLYKLLGGKAKVVATLNNYGGVCPTGGYLCLGRQRCNLREAASCLVQDVGVSWAPLAVAYAAVYPILIRLMRCHDGYIAISDAVKRIYVQHGYAESRIKVIPEFFEAPGQAKDNAVLPRQKKDCFHILYVGRLSREKGVEVLLRAFRRLLGFRRNCYLSIVGGGPREAQLRRLAGELGLTAGHVSFVGQVPASGVWEYYRMADVFVHPGVWAEPFGRTLLEAMVVGVPCVVSNVGAPPEVVGSAGLVFRAGDDGALAEALLSLHDDSAKREKMKHECARVIERYNPEAVVPQILECYAQILRDAQ